MGFVTLTTCTLVLQATAGLNCFDKNTPAAYLLLGNCAPFGYRNKAYRLKSVWQINNVCLLLCMMYNIHSLSEQFQEKYILSFASGACVLQLPV